MNHAAFHHLHTEPTLARVHELVVHAHEAQDVQDHLLPVYAVAYGILADTDRARITSPQGTVLLCAALLHDILEDTPETPAAADALALSIRRSFGDEIANIVVAATRPYKMTRTESNTHTYRALMGVGPDAVFVKLADRIQNVQRCWANRDRRLFLYHREQPGFRTACFHPYHPPIVLAAWRTLDGLLGQSR